MDFEIGRDADATDTQTYLDAVAAGRIHPAATIFQDSISLYDIGSQQYSQELRLQFSSDRLNWLLGLYAFKEESDVNFVVQLLQSTLNLTSTDLYAETDATALAAFTHGTFQISDKLEFEAGLRFTYEEKQMLRSIFTAAPPPALQTDEDLDDDWSDVTGTIGFNYRLRDDILAYISYAQGFKSGGYNITQRGSDSFDPETVDSLELGIKSEWFDRRLRANLAIFNMAYDDLQVRFVSGLGELTVDNAAEATIWGAELEIEAKLSESLLFSFSGGWTDAEYDEYQLGSLDLSGNKLNQAPEWSYRLALNYTRSLGSMGDFRAFVSWYEQDEEFYRAENDPINSNSGYESMDARLSLAGAFGSPLEVSLWVRNLTDKRFVGAVVPLVNDAFFVGAVNRPRTYGVDVSWRF